MAWRSTSWFDPRLGASVYCPVLLVAGDLYRSLLALPTPLPLLWRSPLVPGPRNRTNIPSHPTSDKTRAWQGVRGLGLGVGWPLSPARRRLLVQLSAPAASSTSGRAAFCAAAPPAAVVLLGKGCRGSVRRGIAFLRPAWKQPGPAPPQAPARQAGPPPPPSPGSPRGGRTDAAGGAGRRCRLCGGALGAPRGCLCGTIGGGGGAASASAALVAGGR